jgi:hypothetical protein
MDEFEFFKPNDNPGQEFVKGKTSPSEVFRAFKFDSNEALESFVVKYNIFNDCVTIDNFNILLCYVGTTNKFASLPVLGHNVPANAKSKFIALKNFYEKSRIEGNETRNKKFRRKN